jgi:2-polyprenyl-3-methyl-5-hydroxy-6-metoxy-1,4-benzoquinol methylase
MAIIEDPEEHEAEALKRVAPPFAGARVLEIGCGSGRLTAAYAADAASVIAIDPDPDAIDELRAALPSVTAHAAGIEDFDLPPASVDIVLFAWSL